MDYYRDVPKQQFTDISCSIARAVDVIGQRWTPLIVRDLFAGMTKFEDIRRDLGIASNILATRLDDLERHRIVERRQYQSTPARHEYVLTEKGRDLYPVIATLLAWGDKWLPGPDGPPALIVHTDCGLSRPRRQFAANAVESSTPATQSTPQDQVPRRARARPSSATTSPVSQPRSTFWRESLDLWRRYVRLGVTSARCDCVSVDCVARSCQCQ